MPTPTTSIFTPTPDLTPEAWAAKAAAWINSPEGRTRIEEGQRQAREVIAQLQEERRMTPELWAFRVTI